MKKIIFFILFASFLKTNGQNIMTIKKKDFNFETLISKLFDAKSNNETKEFIWKPNYSEKIDFGVSYDGNLYTKIDTVLIYGKNNEFGTIVTSTYVKDKDGAKEDCHACYPSLSLITFEIDKAKENLDLIYFKKFVSRFGSYGESGQVDYFQISGNTFCIKVLGGYTNMGISTTYQTLYLRGIPILFIDTHEDNLGMALNKNKQTSYTTSITMDKVNKILTLTKKGTEINQKTDQKIQINKIDKYKFDENLGEFTKLCN